MPELTDILFGTMITIALGLASFALKWQFDANADIRVMKTQLFRVESDTSTDSEQNRQMRIFWKLHSWERDQIQEIRVNSGMPLSSWPNFDSEPR